MQMDDLRRSGRIQIAAAAGSKFAICKWAQSSPRRQFFAHRTTSRTRRIAQQQLQIRTTNDEPNCRGKWKTTPRLLERPKSKLKSKKGELGAVTISCQKLFRFRCRCSSLMFSLFSNGAALTLFLLATIISSRQFVAIGSANNNQTSKLDNGANNYNNNDELLMDRQHEQIVGSIFKTNLPNNASLLSASRQNTTTTIDYERKQHTNYYRHYHREGGLRNHGSRAPRGFCTHISRILSPNARCYAHLLTTSSTNKTNTLNNNFNEQRAPEELVYVRLETLGSKLTDLNTLAINERLLASLFHQLLQLNPIESPTNNSNASKPASSTTTWNDQDSATIDELRMQILPDSKPNNTNQTASDNSNHKCRLAMEKFLCRLVYPTCHFRRRDVSALVRPPCRQDCLLLRDSLCPNLDWNLFSKGLSLALARGLASLPISSIGLATESESPTNSGSPTETDSNGTGPNSNRSHSSDFSASSRGYNLNSPTTQSGNAHFYWPHEKSIQHCESLPAHLQQELHQKYQREHIATNVKSTLARPAQFKGTQNELLELHNNNNNNNNCSSCRSSSSYNDVERQSSSSIDNNQFASSNRAASSPSERLTVINNNNERLQQQQPLKFPETTSHSIDADGPETSLESKSALLINSKDNRATFAVSKALEAPKMALNGADSGLNAGPNGSNNIFFKQIQTNKLYTKNSYNQKQLTSQNGNQATNMRFASWPSCSNAHLSSIGAELLLLDDINSNNDRLFKANTAHVHANKLDCLETKDGSSYQGQVNITNSGITCQAWHDQEPHKHQMSELLFDNMINPENYCRNPGGLELMPWCYTKDPKIRWRYCNIEPCKQE